ncbi:hypothetical protein V8E53_007692 [Lactarius tabidus]
MCLMAMKAFVPVMGVNGGSAVSLLWLEERGVEGTEIGHALKKTTLSHVPTLLISTQPGHGKCVLIFGYVVTSLSLSICHLQANVRVWAHSDTPSYKHMFSNKQIICIEYMEITEDDECKIFSRVQLGMALNYAKQDAKKMKAEALTP